jgi:ACS family hexuronate transporter-like MFS transporter
LSVQTRWVAVAIFVLSSTLNYLDRQLFAALEPVIRKEFALSYEGFGYLITAYALIYAVGATVLGLTLDRLGLRGGSALTVGLWSLATVGMSWVGGLGSLVGFRMLLGFAQGGGIPATGKAFGTFLPPEERAFGTASNQIGISLGMILAPLWINWATQYFGWRQAFLGPGLLGFLWIPLMWWATKGAPEQPVTQAPAPVGDLLRRRSYWGVLLANGLGMMAYALWSSWTTAYLVKTWGDGGLAWLPPVFAVGGGVIGGTLAFRWMKAGLPAPAARRRAALVGAIVLGLATASVPAMPGALWASVAIGMSFLGSLILSVNVYALPLDLFGAGRAGFAVASLTAAYALMQAVTSPLVGRIVDLYGFGPVCWATAVLPLLGVLVLYSTKE